MAPARIDTTFPSGGEECAAYVYRPEGDGEAPCVVMGHGFSATRDDRMPEYAERFVAAGMACVVFDYRYFGASTGEPRQLLDIGKQHEDWEAAIAFARGLDGIDATRIALWGSSFSGGHAQALAIRHGATGPSAITAVIAQAPYVDGLAALKEIPPANLARATAEGLIDQASALLGRPPRMMPVVGDPGTFALLTAAEAKPGFESIAPPYSRWKNEVCARIALRIALYRPGAHPEKIPCPILYCVCDDDHTTPPGPAIAAAERAPYGELIRYPMGHFEIYVGEGFEKSSADQTAFLVRHFGLGAPAAAPEATASA